MNEEKKTLKTEDAVIEAIYASRGRILQLAIETETLMDIFIAYYFTDDEFKIDEFISTILVPHISFGKKKELFQYTMEKSGLLEEGQIKKTMEVIKVIVEERNIFAHWPLDFSEEALYVYEQLRIVTLKKMKIKRLNGQLQYYDTKPYSDKSINAQIKICQEMNDFIKGLIKFKDEESLRRKTGKPATP